MVNALQDIVEVSSRIAGAEGQAREGFGAALFITTDDTLDRTGSGKVKKYRSLAAVSDDFDNTDEPYKAAAVYFAQTPYPKPFSIARWETTNTQWSITGGTPAAVGSLVALADPTLIINGVTTVIDIPSGSTTGAQVAAAIQTALRANTEPGFSNAEVTFGNNVYTLTFGTDSDGLAVEMSKPTGTLAADTTGVDFENETVDVGVRGETASTMIAAVRSYNDDWYFLCADENIVDTTFADDLSEWAEASDRMAALDTHDADILDATPSGVGYDIAAEDRQRTFLFYSPRSDYKAVSLAAKFSAVDFDQSNAIITGKFKQLPNTTADTLSEDDVEALDGLSVNHYTFFGGTAIVAEGVTTKDDTYIDVRYWVDWFVNGVRREVFNLLLRSNRIPQTNAGIALVKGVVIEMCEQGRQNGGIAPGRVSDVIANDIRAATGVQSFDGDLSQGYLVYIPAASELTDTQLQARELPNIRVWLKGSGAIHSVDIDITFN